MKLVEMKCKNCGSILEVEEGSKNIKCNYCHSEYILDDEIQYVKYDNMEQTGYEFEKGKIRAQKEAEQETINNQNEMRQVLINEEKRKKNLKWKILAWIFLFPFILTYYIIKTDKLDKNKKIIIIVIMWVMFFLIAYLNSSEDTNKNINNTTNNILNQQINN